MLRLTTIDEVLNYINTNSKEFAIFIDYNIDFLILKYFQYKQELENVYYLFDFIQNVENNEIKYIHSDYEEDTPFQEDVQIYMGNQIIKNSNIIGTVTQSYNGVASVNYSNLQYIYDMRGFISSIYTSNSILLFNQQGKHILTILGDQIIENNNSYLINDYIEVKINEFIASQYK